VEGLTPLKVVGGVRGAPGTPKLGAVAPEKFPAPNVPLFPLGPLSNTVTSPGTSAGLLKLYRTKVPESETSFPVGGENAAVYRARLEIRKVSNQPINAGTKFPSRKIAPRYDAAPELLMATDTGRDATCTPSRKSRSSAPSST